jgi:hypothetical protein
VDYVESSGGGGPVDARPHINKNADRGYMKFPMTAI